MSDLAERVNSGICPACPKDLDRGFENPAKGACEVILDTVPIGLALPTAKRPAVVTDGQLQAAQGLRGAFKVRALEFGVPRSAFRARRELFLERVAQ